MTEHEHPTTFNTPPEVVESIKLFAGNKMVKMKMECGATRTKVSNSAARSRRAKYRKADEDYVATMIERGDG